jgi:hypothetical protein
VLSTSPPDGGKDVPLNSLVTATFSEPMNSSTITKDTFTVKKEDEASPMIGNITLSQDSKTAKFEPTLNFSAKTKYIATIDIGAKDLAGNALASVKTWSFTTI